MHSVANSFWEIILDWAIFRHITGKEAFFMYIIFRNYSKARTLISDLKI